MKTKTMNRFFLSLLTLTTLAACDSGQEQDGPNLPTEQSASTGSVDALRVHTSEFMSREEHTDPSVEVRHLLVSFRGRGVGGVQRSQEEAEALAAELYERAVGGEDFAALVAEHSDDSPEGVYRMVLSGGQPPTTWNRNGMVAAFGDAGWRLQPGELGVVGFDPQRSPYGWHLVMRLE